MTTKNSVELSVGVMTVTLPDPSTSVVPITTGSFVTLTVPVRFRLRGHYTLLTNAIIHTVLTGDLRH